MNVTNRSLLGLISLMLLLTTYSVAQINLPAPGQTTVVAGNGTNGNSSGSGGLATNAVLDDPAAVAIDSAGNLYIAEYCDNRVRMVSAATGVISNFAGTGSGGGYPSSGPECTGNTGPDYNGDGHQATQTNIGAPIALAVDSANNVYIADQGHNRVLKVSTSGIVTTVAGNGTTTIVEGVQATTSGLGTLQGLAVDSSGNVFISDSSDNVILEVVAATGKLRRVAGTGFLGDFCGQSGALPASGDGGPALSANLENIYGLAVDSGGNVYVGDSCYHTVRMIAAANGYIYTIAGNGTSGSSGDGGSALSAQLIWPIGVAITASGDILIADNWSNSGIRKVSASTGIISTLAIPDPGNCIPAGVAIDSKGYAYVPTACNTVQARLLTVPTSTTISSSNPSVYYGTNVTFTATVTSSSGTPTGTVTFLSDGGVIGQSSLSGGSAAFSTSQLSIGTHSIVAQYAGNAPWSASTSDPLSQKITKIPTGIIASTSPNPSVYGNPVTIPITVTATNGSTPTGTAILIADGSESLGSPTLDGSGKATVVYSRLKFGVHSIVAQYPGTSVYDNSSITFSHTVNKATTTTPSPVLPGNPSDPITIGTPIQITIPPGQYPSGGNPPSNPITVLDGNTPIGSVPITGGTITYTPPTVGPHPINTCYLGDDNYVNTCQSITGGSGGGGGTGGSGGTGSTTVKIVAPTTTTVIATPNPTVFGTAASIAANVVSSYGVPTGTTSCSSDIGQLGNGTLDSSGHITMSGAQYAVGSHTITCVYSPTGYFASSSGSTVLLVQKATPTVTVSTSPDPTYPGDYFTVAVTVAGVSLATPSGTVDISIDGTQTNTLTLSSGTAQTQAALFTGTHVIAATYHGDANYNGASGTTNHKVIILPTTSEVGSTPNPGIATQQQIKLTAAVAFPSPQPGTPNIRKPITGTVTFYDGGVSLGSASVDSTLQSASITVPSMSLGTHSLSASYGGDTNHAPSATTGQFIETLLAPISGVTVSSTQSASVSVGGSTTYTAAITNPLGIPQTTGTVTWSAEGTVLGTSAVGSDGSTQFTTPTTAFAKPGIYSIVANYDGPQPGVSTISQAVLTSAANGAPYAIASADDTLNLTFGGSTTTNISFSYVGNIGTVQLGCAPGSALLICSLSTPSIVLDGKTTPTIALSVKAAPQTSSLGQTTYPYLCMAAIVLLTPFRRRKVWALLSVVSVVLSIGAMSGCKALDTSAKAATYAVTVTATAGNYTQSQVITVKLK